MIRNISESIADHVEFYPYFFSFGNLSQKSSLWFRSIPVKNISHKCHNFNFLYLHYF